MIYALVLAALLVAFANGGNDNAKGVAMLIGSRIASLRSALRWGNLATFLGSLAAIPMALFVNAALIQRFGGAGLLPKGFSADAHYLLAVAIGAAVTVLLATRLGFPISTTHSLLGALVGAGFIAVGPQRLLWSGLGSKFVAPLLFSPALAAGTALVLYPLLRKLQRSGSLSELCLCVEQAYVPVVEVDGAMILSGSGRILTVDELARCEVRRATPILTYSVTGVMRVSQYVTSGLVSFARGLNDTPKMAGVLAAASALGLVHEATQAFSVAPVIGSIALAMLLGGMTLTRRVAKTMSEEITVMNGAQGLLASAITALLVLLASFAGLPVSTTHVAVGSLFGIGLANRTGRLKTLWAILIAWITTVPFAALVAAVAYAAKL